MVELKEFIRQTLFDLSEGVREANAAYKQSRNIEENAFVLSPGRGEKEGTGIHFDVAVTTQAARGGQASIKVLSLGVGGERQHTSESVSRIRFTVTVHHYLG